MAKDEGDRIRELVDGMMAGDKPAMKAFFTFIDGLQSKKLGNDGERALSVVVSIVELLLPMRVRLAYTTASGREKKKPVRPGKRVGKKKRR